MLVEQPIQMLREKLPGVVPDADPEELPGQVPLAVRHEELEPLVLLVGVPVRAQVVHVAALVHGLRVQLALLADHLQGDAQGEWSPLMVERLLELRVEVVGALRGRDRADDGVLVPEHRHDGAEEDIGLVERGLIDDDEVGGEAPGTLN